MPFDPELVEAQLALHRIATTDMPKLAWDALEAGLDGPATRRLAALRLAKRRAREILQSNNDPLKHAGDFDQMWVEAGYCKELADYGPLAETVYVARRNGESDNQIRAWLLEKLKALAGT